MKDRIIEIATSHYACYGMKAASMSSIAAELRISKRTLYEYFPDKNALVFECVRCKAESYKEQLEKTEAEAAIPLKAILNISEVSLQQVLQLCPAFLRDLECFPEAKQQIYGKCVSSAWRKYVRLFFDCVGEGVFPSDVNINMILDFFMNQIKITAKKYWAGQTNAPAIYFSSNLTFLAGICTDKGRQELKLYNPSDFFSTK